MKTRLLPLLAVSSICLAGCNNGGALNQNSKAETNKLLAAGDVMDLGAPAIAMGRDLTKSPPNDTIYGSIKSFAKPGCFDPNNTFTSVENDYSYKSVLMFQSQLDLSTQLAASMNLSGGYGLFSANVSGAYTDVKTSSNREINFVYYNTKQFHLNLKPKNNDLSQSMYPDKLNLFDQDENKFYEQCGSAYVSSIALGIISKAQITISFTSQSEAENMKAQMNMKYGTFADFSASIEKNTDLQKSSASVNIKIETYGMTDSVRLGACTLSSFKGCEDFMTSADHDLDGAMQIRLNQIENGTFFRGQAGKYISLNNIAGTGLQYLGISDYGIIDEALDNSYRPAQSLVKLRNDLVNNYNTSVTLRAALANAQFSQYTDPAKIGAITDYLQEIYQYINDYEYNLSTVKSKCYKSLSDELVCRDLVMGKTGTFVSNLLDTTLFGRINALLGTGNKLLFDNEGIHNTVWIPYGQDINNVYYYPINLNQYMALKNSLSNGNYSSAYVAYSRYQAIAANNDTYIATDLSDPARMTVMAIPNAGLNEGNFNVYLSFFNPQKQTNPMSKALTGTYNHNIPLTCHSLAGRISCDAPGAKVIKSAAQINTEMNNNLFDESSLSNIAVFPFTAGESYERSDINALSIDPELCLSEVQNAVQNNAPMLSTKCNSKILWNQPTLATKYYPLYGFDPNIFTNLQTSEINAYSFVQENSGSYTDPYSITNTMESFIKVQQNMPNLKPMIKITQHSWPYYLVQDKNNNLDQRLDISDCLNTLNKPYSDVKSAILNTGKIFADAKTGAYKLLCSYNEIPGNYLQDCTNISYKNGILSAVCGVKQVQLNYAKDCWDQSYVSFTKETSQLECVIKKGQQNTAPEFSNPDHRKECDNGYWMTDGKAYCAVRGPDFNFTGSLDYNKNCNPRDKIILKMIAYAAMSCSK